MTLPKTDEDVATICLASIRRHGMDVASWKLTILDAMHDELRGHVMLAENESPIVSFFLSAESWYVMTTRRVIGRHRSAFHDLPTWQILSCEFGDFKGNSGAPTVTMRLQAANRDDVELQYETGKASMAPIDAIGFLCHDHYGNAKSSQLPSAKPWWKFW